MKEQMSLWGLRAPYLEGLLNDITKGREALGIVAGPRGLRSDPRLGRSNPSVVIEDISRLRRDLDLGEHPRSVRFPGG